MTTTFIIGLPGGRGGGGGAAADFVVIIAIVISINDIVSGFAAMRISRTFVSGP